MVSGPRCPPGLWGLLALLLPLPGARGTCDSPPRLHFAELPGVVNNSYPVGTKLKYSCRPGYILSSGKSPFVTCLENSKWSVEAEFCEGRRCKPLELENGRADITDLRFGARANFSCDEGYRLIGQTSAQCVIVGNGVDWDTEVPLCQAIPCRPPPDITQGSHNGQSGEEFSFGSAVTYKCDPGLSLIGEASIHCTTKDHFNGEWSGPAPECKGLNTGTVIAIGVVIGLFVAGGFVAIVTYKACFGKKGPYEANQRFSDLQERGKKTNSGLERKDAYHSCSADS
ncbi:complement decay-accelerating factor-like isoform X4 [Lepidochelys kempii]|uniref:complement decay-accelerating factor-like isoform X4 n=1 Tax=Lepidochelys kempii TaxID=8472 RepID=UPI003C700F06